MSKDRQKVQIVVVCEDNAHAVLVRRFLFRRGYHPKKLRFETGPPGRGSGEQHVKKLYPTELASYRLRNPLYWRLIVVLDADTGTVIEHETELAAVAVVAGQPPRQPTEGVVHLIPKRNIETWVHRLLGNAVDEITDYKSHYSKLSENDYCRPAADALVELAEDPTQQPDLPSLRRGVAELRDKMTGSR